MNVFENTKSYIYWWKQNHRTFEVANVIVIKYQSSIRTMLVESCHWGSQQEHQLLQGLQLSPVMENKAING